MSVVLPAPATHQTLPVGRARFKNGDKDGPMVQHDPGHKQSGLRIVAYLTIQEALSDSINWPPASHCDKNVCLTTQGQTVQTTTRHPCMCQKGNRESLSKRDRRISTYKLPACLYT